MPILFAFFIVFTTSISNAQFELTENFKDRFRQFLSDGSPGAALGNVVCLGDSLSALEFPPETVGIADLHRELVKSHGLTEFVNVELHESEVIHYSIVLDGRKFSNLNYDFKARQVLGPTYQPLTGLPPVGPRYNIVSGVDFNVPNPKNKVDNSAAELAELARRFELKAGQEKMYTLDQALWLIAYHIKNKITFGNRQIKSSFCISFDMAEAENLGLFINQKEKKPTFYVRISFRAAKKSGDEYVFLTKKNKADARLMDLLEATKFALSVVSVSKQIVTRGAR